MINICETNYNNFPSFEEFYMYYNLMCYNPVIKKRSL